MGLLNALFRLTTLCVQSVIREPGSHTWGASPENVLRRGAQLPGPKTVFVSAPNVTTEFSAIIKVFYESQKNCPFFAPRRPTGNILRFIFYFYFRLNLFDFTEST